MLTPRIFLVAATAGLVPIALSYGLVPDVSMGYLFNIDASSVNMSHIFRAMMGLYLALAQFWLMGAMKKSLQRPALYSLIVFMLGLATGRVYSLLIDGIPHWLLVVYLFLELGFGFVGITLVRKTDPPR